ncbi:hypothetical protein VTJ04DRAFT_6435 [Mycothermus thermophilus]|uniref:uncharacterized protein n=1 Tax=Humicola insolens TaxID=85995 RepID=UPI003742C4C6
MSSRAFILLGQFVKVIVISDHLHRWLWKSREYKTSWSRILRTPEKKPAHTREARRSPNMPSTSKAANARRHRPSNPPNLARDILPYVHTTIVFARETKQDVYLYTIDLRR